MLRFVFLGLFLAVNAASALPKFSNGDRIVGGRNATIEEFPWQISLRKQNLDTGLFKHFCGGSVLTERIMLTAAHCVFYKDPKRYVIVAGTSYRAGDDGITVPALTFLWHEFYDSFSVDNDIALILLAKPLPLNDLNIMPVVLASEDPKTGDIITVSGWGTTGSTQHLTEVLNAVDIPFVSNEECGKKYGEGLILESMFCAGSPTGGKDSCQGDSGGPLVMENVQYGVVSWGEGCGKATRPGVYSSVAYFRPWLDKNIEKFMLE